MIASVVVAFILLLARSTALCMVAPIIGARSVPPRVRLAIAFLLTSASFSFAMGDASATATSAANGGLGTLGAALFREVAFGIIVGAASRAFVEAAVAAGQTLALAAGLGMGATLDPQHGAPSSAPGELVSLLTLSVALGLGLHRELFSWFCVTVREAPPGAPLELGAFLDVTLDAILRSIALGARLAFPVMAATLAAHVVVGVAGRAVPQMSLQNVAFAIPLLVGGWALSVCAHDLADIAARASLDVIHALAGDA